MRDKTAGEINAYAVRQFFQKRVNQNFVLGMYTLNSHRQAIVTPFAVHLRKIYIHLPQQLQLYGKYTFISTSMNFIRANELSIILFA